LAELARSGEADQALFAALGAALPPQTAHSAPDVEASPALQDDLSRLTAYLIAQNMLRPAELARAQALAAQSRTRLPAVLTRLGLIPDKSLADAFVTATDAVRAAEPLVPLEPLPAELNPRFLALHACVPLHLDDDEMCFATSDPSNSGLRQGLAFAFGEPGGGRKIMLQVAPDSSITRALALMEREEESHLAAPSETSQQSLRADMTALEDAGSEAPVVRLVGRLIQQAVQRGASDIHIEALPRALVVRFRIDGDLQVVEELEDSYAAPVASRIKVMAGLDIAEKRLPQDGRIRTSVDGETLDIRVSTTPTVHGEGVVMRLLGRSTVALDLDRLERDDIILQHILSL
jgi:general secretion pathway protein E